MKAVVYEGPGRLSYREVSELLPKEDEVKLRIKACGICGSDIHGYMGLTGRRQEPMIMGHEFMGEIVEVGNGIGKEIIGDRVAVYPVSFCGKCKMCMEGKVHLCLNKKAYGVLDVNGAFAEYICVPKKCCFSLADNVSDAVGSLAEPLAVAYRGVGYAGNIEGKTVLVVGAGTIGLLVLACIKMKNPAEIIVSDLNDKRLDIARQMGADITINPEKENFKDKIESYTDGKGVDIAIEAVGITVTVQQTIEALGFSGMAIWIGNSKPIVEVNMQKIVTKELKIHGSFLYGYQEFKEVIDLLNHEKINVAPLISKKIRLYENPEYFEKLAQNPEDLIKVIVTDE